jgi:hypothetical protein
MSTRCGNFQCPLYTFLPTDIRQTNKEKTDNLRNINLNGYCNAINSLNGTGKCFDQHNNKFTSTKGNTNQRYKNKIKD